MGKMQNLRKTTTYIVRSEKFHKFHTCQHHEQTKTMVMLFISQDLPRKKRNKTSKSSPRNCPEAVQLRSP